MAKLVYAMIASLDGYIADEDGDFSWAEPDPEVHGFINELERPLATYLYGRNMYEMMTAWQDLPVDERAEMNDFAELWRAADKIVYSTTLPEVSTPRTRLVRSFDPEAVARLKDTSEGDIAVSGPGLAAHALRAGLVDECHLFVVPVVRGGGLSWLPEGVRLDLELIEEKRFTGGVVFLRYGVKRGAPPAAR
ncbi:dihydrofolate reductase family protein [Phytomonospora sp. NPDC050363]|uniref:dihydrofolate reductase family protein n=1 Tax=Phytomonospora sp. NPDC050363 TaxID=3155642 RepID=UPI0033DADDC5